MYSGPKRRDANQRRIVNALRRVGASVVITADVGGGFPDLVVGWRGVTYLVEVKNRTRLTPRQKRFRETWQGGEIVVLNSVEDALRWIMNVGIVGQPENQNGKEGKEVDSESHSQAGCFPRAGEARGDDSAAVCAPCAR